MHRFGKIFEIWFWGAPLCFGGMIIGLIQTRLLDDSIRPIYFVTAWVSSIILGLFGGVIALYNIDIIAEVVILTAVLIYGLPTSIVLFIFRKVEATT